MNKVEKAAAIAAITQIFKYYGAPSSWCPMIAIALGAILEYSENPTPIGILNGVIFGSIVTGSYGMLKGAAQATVAKPTPQNFSLMEAEDDRGV